LELDDESLIASFSDAPEADQADIEAARLPNVEADERSAIEPFSQRVSPAHLPALHLRSPC
jgi:hypothetical protein